MNGISKYHSGIIETGKCTIEGLNGTEWYSMVFPNTIQGTIETDRYTIEGLNGTEWYWMVLNGIEWYTIDRFL